MYQLVSQCLEFGLVCVNTLSESYVHASLRMHPCTHTKREGRVTMEGGVEVDGEQRLMCSFYTNGLHL